MKVMISWRERPMGSASAYENAQKRILAVFKHYKFPESMKVLQFVIRVGDWGGYMLVETTDMVSVHKFTSMLPAFEFRMEQVIDIGEAVSAELEIMAWRDSLPAD
jgi:muconolactone delta-isomerase